MLPLGPKLILWTNFIWIACYYFFVSKFNNYGTQGLTFTPSLVPQRLDRVQQGCLPGGVEAEEDAHEDGKAEGQRHRAR